MPRSPSGPVVVTGASSFLGAHLVRRLAASRPVVAVVHRTDLVLRDVEANAAGRPAMEVVRADLTSGIPEDVPRRRPAAVVHLACKTADAAANGRMLDAVLDLCRATGAPLVHASTTQVGWARQNAYARGRADEEARIAASGLPHVVLRPCAPYGPRLPDHQPRHEETFHRLADAVARWPAVPLIANGRPLRQPVHVDDWNDVVLRFLDRASEGAGAMPNRAFDVGGPAALSFAAIVDQLALHFGRRPLRVNVPLAAAKLGARLVPGMGAEMLSTFDCDDVVDLGPVSHETGKTDWIPFSLGLVDLGRDWTHWDAARKPTRGPSNTPTERRRAG